MCHLILALPLVALPLLWLLPPSVGVPVYGLAVFIALATYRLALRSMRMPVQNGPEALEHAVGVVKWSDARRLSVWVGGELWSAQAMEGAPDVGENVEVVGHRGITLLVRRCDAGCG